jgi:hypothetical protein
MYLKIKIWRHRDTLGRKTSSYIKCVRKSTAKDNRKCGNWSSDVLYATMQDCGDVSDRLRLRKSLNCKGRGPPSNNHF